MNRRRFLALAGSGFASVAARGFTPGPRLAAEDDAFLDGLQQQCFRYFAEKTDPNLGLTLDRGCTNGGPYTLDARPTASLTVTGFGLAAYSIAATRGWLPRAEALARVKAAVRFFARQAPHERGWFYHWLHLRSGARAGAFSEGTALSEVSTIDTAFLIAGALAARQCFAEDAELAGLVDEIYHRIDFPWMLREGSLILGHGWTPEHGFIPSWWDEYSEASILYLLAIASPTHPIAPESWYAWKRTPNVYGRYRYIGTASLFTVQYSHVFVDFQGLRDNHGKGVDWFANSVTATRAHRQFCMDLASRFPEYNGEIWGITASRSATGYTDWGGPPMDPRIDGTVVPGAVAGSLMLTPDLCVPSLRAMARQYGAEIDCRYGFTDSFNPCTDWVSPDVTGLNVGITLLSAENLRSGRLWIWYMANPEARRGLELAGFE